jgi:branched-subunit amino acid transport protein
MPKWGVLLSFVAMAALAWGVYVPIVHEASMRLQSNLRAFLFVGVAYFLVAILIPSILIFGLHFDPTAKGGGSWAFSSALWGIAAGTAGAIGALGIIFATNAGGKDAAIYVAPLVFAGAPIINTIATMTYFHPVKTMPDWRFFLGLVLAAGGMAMVLLFRPQG